jgi:hypothetical protein
MFLPFPMPRAAPKENGGRRGHAIRGFRVGIIPPMAKDEIIGRNLMGA